MLPCKWSVYEAALQITKSSVGVWARRESSTMLRAPPPSPMYTAPPFIHTHIVSLGQARVIHHVAPSPPLLHTAPPSPPFLHTHIVSLGQARVIHHVACEVEGRVEQRGIGEEVRIHEVEQSVELTLEGGGGEQVKRTHVGGRELQGLPPRPSRIHN